MYQEELKYTKTHEWVKMYKNHIARVGVTEHAQNRFGKVLFVELPEVDGEHEQFDSFVVIEAEKMLSEVYAPLSGKVVEVNEELDEDPTIINHDPYGDGWLVELDISHLDELENLMDYEQYERFLADGGDDD
jgi:glycine cleavage system H protein